MPIRLLLPVALLSALACGDSTEHAGSSDEVLSSPSAMRAVEAAGGASLQADAVAPTPSPARGAQSPADEPKWDVGEERMVIRTGHAEIEVDALEPAVAEVQRLASRLGGRIGNVRITGGEHQVRRATIVVKLPADAFDDAVDALEHLGSVENVNVTAEDVTEEFVDVSARLRNAKRLEERLLALLDDRTAKLSEVLQVERELARVRSEIERFEGRMRYLRSRVAESTLTVRLSEPEPLVRTDGENPIVRAFANAWRNFVGTVAALIEGLGALLPVLLVLAALLWPLVRALGRRRRARRDG